MLNKYALQVVSFISVAILARLLTPEEIGLFAIASSLAFVATSLRTFGVSEYLVREKDINPAKVKTVVGVMVIMSWGLGTVFLFAAPWIADFYGQADLKDLLWIISAPFFLAPFCSIPLAILARDMRFDAILRSELTGCVVHNSVAILLVLKGFSYYGPAWGVLAGVVAEFLVITYFRPSTMRWMPSFRNIGEVFAAGTKISVSNLCLQASQNCSDLILGRMSTLNNVGIFSRGLGLILFLNELVIRAVGRVALPHLSRVRREGGDVAAAYLNAVALIGAVALPLFAVVNLTSDAMIVALFGDQWTFSAGLASTLTLWAMLQSMHCFAKPALLTVGQERLFLVKEVQSLAVKVVFIILALPYGLEAVAWAFVVSGVVDFVVVYFLLWLALRLNPLQMLASFLPNALVALACWGVLKGVHTALDLRQYNEWMVILITGCCMVPVWLLALKLTRNALWPHVVTIGQDVGRKLLPARAS